jgi:hypothetical protein
MATDSSGDGVPTDGSRRGERRPVATLSDWLRPRARLVLTSVGVGAAVGVLLTAALALGYDPAFAARKAFGVGLLAFGFGVVGWSGSVLAGPGLENMQRHLDTGSDWSETDSRRAMVRVASAGFGVAILAPPVAGLFGL